MPKELGVTATQSVKLQTIALGKAVEHINNAERYGRNAKQFGAMDFSVRIETLRQQTQNLITDIESQLPKTQ